tara:strand:- start:201 stop:467 length:267 start_codon:yes stop_codon:yes gene_type:complete
LRAPLVLLPRFLQRDLGVREKLGGLLQSRAVLGVRLDERVEDGPLLLEPVLPACSIKGETRGAPQKMILRRRPQDVELRADGVAVVGP